MLQIAFCVLGETDDVEDHHVEVPEVTVRSRDIDQVCAFGMLCNECGEAGPDEGGGADDSNAKWSIDRDVFRLTSGAPGRQPLLLTRVTHM